MHPQSFFFCAQCCVPLIRKGHFVVCDAEISQITKWAGGLHAIPHLYKYHHTTARSSSCREQFEMLFALCCTRQSFNTVEAQHWEVKAIAQSGLVEKWCYNNMAGYYKGIKRDKYLKIRWDKKKKDTFSLTWHSCIDEKAFTITVSLKTALNQLYWLMQLPRKGLWMDPVQVSSHTVATSL